MLCSGEVQSIDLRMLDKGLVTEFAGSAGLRAPQECASVATASKDAAGSLECVLPRRLSGGSANLIATVHGGALLGEFGKVLEGTLQLELNRPVCMLLPCCHWVQRLPFEWHITLVIGL